MRFVIFCHSVLSDWNHGNAHFLRGVATELAARGHDVRMYEPRDAWSVLNLVRDHGEAPLDAVRTAFPTLRPFRYERETLDLDRALDGADLVLVHEWNDPDLVAELGRRRSADGSYRLLFHDTHHRGVTDPGAIARFDLSAYDGVLAFGAVLRDLYLARGWALRAFTWHEAADTRVFRPQPGVANEGDVVWVGNWGDDERTAELRGVPARAGAVARPARARLRRALPGGGPARARRAPASSTAAGSRTTRSRARSPPSARRCTCRAGPTRPRCPGIPTIRPFEALACGIPLVCAPWRDVEGLFAPGRDFLVARDGAEMKRRLRAGARRPGQRRGDGRARPTHRARAPHVRPSRRRSCSRSSPSSTRNAGRLSREEGRRMRIAFFGSSLVSAYWNGAATYYRGIVRALHGRRAPRHLLRARRVRPPEAPRHPRPRLGRGRRLRRRGRGRGRSAPSPPPAAPTSWSRRAGSASSTRCSRRRSSLCGGRERSLCSGTSTRPRRSTGSPATPRDPFAALMPRYDLVLTYGGGDPVVRALRGERARAGAFPSTTRSTRRRTTRSRRTRASRRTFRSSAIGCRTARRASRSSSSRAARAAPSCRFLLGGAGWDASMFPPNVRYAGHVYTRDHNAFNGTPRLVLNVSRESMARYGFSPATRVFEAAGAGACIITDAWEGIDLFLEPGREVLVATDGEEVAAFVRAVLGARGTRDRAGGAPPRARRAHLRPPRGPARGRAGGPGAPGRRATGGGRVSAIATAGHEPSRLRVVILGLTITSSWGNGHATTYRGLVRELAARGHDVLFLERDQPWYAENRDLPEPPYGRTRLYRSVRGAALAVRGRRAAGRPGGRRLLRAGGDRRRRMGHRHRHAARPPSTTSTRR